MMTARREEFGAVACTESITSWKFFSVFNGSLGWFGHRFQSQALPSHATGTLQPPLQLPGSLASVLHERLVVLPDVFHELQR